MKNFFTVAYNNVIDDYEYPDMFEIEGEIYDEDDFLDYMRDCGYGYLQTQNKRIVEGMKQAMKKKKSGQK